jgi:hypothetical protein
MSIAWGKPGREVQHQWGAGGLILNDRHPAGAARYVIDKLTGWYSLPEIEDARRTAGSHRGEVVLPTYPRGKTVVYEGRVEARTLPAWRGAYRALLASFQERNAEGQMLLLGETQWFIRARVLQLDADDDPDRLDPRRPWPFTAPFTLGLRQSDGRTYALPMLSHGNGLGNVVTNLGTADTDPVIAFTTGGGDVALQNTTLGRTLVFRDLPSGDYVASFGPGDRRVYRQGDGADFSGYLDADDSNWWDELVPGLVPGANTLAITGTTSWQVDFYHADA